ncbi:islet cell autoantigen 1-like protein [Microplitis demolitor]|uniref:islet cell autoantigen 1-like protein n=1 Tax=Microplitis demolitor TaxID=69319 RepID=UPI0004CCBD85|nr:islet cell autoantigen 1-like protein [Microplitis demolitor]
MNTYDNRGGGREGAGVSGNAFDRWVQRSSSDMTDDSAIIKMQHQYWVTKQTLSRKLGKKEDECIVASDAELDAKLQLFKSIQESCSHLLRVIDKYQERLCILAQEENTMGRFLKDAGKQDKTRAGKMMSAVGKSLSYSGQQRLTLRGPLIRLYQEVETFRNRAVEDTYETVQSMEKARTEYRAALSWMKNISQELDPDTSKQLERFRKVQTRVRRGKTLFDNQALDCLQKVDLLAAARCNMFSHALVLYQTTLFNFTQKSAQAYSTIANSFKGYQHYDFMVVKELAETSSKLARETTAAAAAAVTANDVDDADTAAEANDYSSSNYNNKNNYHDNDKLLFFDTDDVSVEKAQQAIQIDDTTDEKNNKYITTTTTTTTAYNNQLDDILLDIGENNKNVSDISPAATPHDNVDNDKELEEFFGIIPSYKIKHHNAQHVKELEKSLAELDLKMDSFTGDNVNFDFDFDNATSFTPSSSTVATISKDQAQQNSLQSLTSENIALLDEILDSGTKVNSEWDTLINDSFLPPGILKQSLGDAVKGKNLFKSTSDENKKKKGKQKGNSWLDLFAELDPLANNSIESLPRSIDKNAPPV